MYSDKIKKIGEHSSVAEELLYKIPDLEIRCRAVQKSVNKRYYSFSEALKNYKVNEMEYFLYSYSKNIKEIERKKKSRQILTLIADILSIYSSSINNFTPTDKRRIKSIEKILSEEG